jgi:hypothetical protein
MFKMPIYATIIVILDQYHHDKVGALPRAVEVFTLKLENGPSDKVYNSYRTII